MMFSRRFSAISIVLFLALLGFVASYSPDAFHGSFITHPFDDAMKKNFEFQYIGKVVESRPACGTIHLNVTAWLNGSIASHIIDPLVARYANVSKLHEVTKNNSVDQLSAHLKIQKATWKLYRANFIKNSVKGDGFQLSHKDALTSVPAAVADYAIGGLEELIFGDDTQAQIDLTDLFVHVESAYAKSIVASGLSSLEREFSTFLRTITSSRALDQKMADFLGGNAAIERIISRFINEYDTSSIKSMGTDGLSLITMQATGAEDESVSLMMCVPSSLQSESLELVHIVPKGVFDGGEYLVPMLPSAHYAVQKGTSRLEELLVVEEAELVQSSEINVVQRFRAQKKGCSLSDVGGCPVRRYYASSDFVHVTPLGNRKFIVATTKPYGTCNGDSVPLSKFFVFDENNGCVLKIADFRIGRPDVEVQGTSPGIHFIEDTVKEASNESKEWTQSQHIAHFSIIGVALSIAVVLWIVHCVCCCRRR